MSGWYELGTNARGQYSFVLKAANTQTILHSEQYESKAAALNGIASVQTNAPLEERYDLKSASDGRVYFTLRAGNGQVIGTSQMYASPATRATGMASVQTNGPSSEIRGA